MKNIAYLPLFGKYGNGFDTTSPPNPSARGYNTNNELPILAEISDFLNGDICRLQ